MSAVDFDLLAELSDVSAQVDVALDTHTTYRLGGNAKALITVESADELAQIATCLAAHGITTEQIFVLGRGSNVLIADNGFNGIVIKLGNGMSQSPEVPQAPPNAADDAIITLSAGCALPIAARTLAVAGLRGFEWAVGVPGTVGGAVRMNAGGHGSDIAATIETATVVDVATGTTQVRTHDNLALGYRSSSIQPNEVVVDATIRLQTGDSEAALQEISEIITWRRDNQPGGRNSGSVFTNPSASPSTDASTVTSDPSATSAGALIEAVGGKGLQVGGAQISPKHANFIQANEEATAQDVIDLMTQVQNRVHEHFGIHLVPETRLIGFDELPKSLKAHS